MVHGSYKNMDSFKIFEAMVSILHEGIISKNIKTEIFIVNQRYFFWETIY